MIYAFRQNKDKTSPRRVRQLDYISQFSTDIRYLEGVNNNVADLLSRINVIDKAVNFEELAEEQDTDDELKSLLESGNKHSLILKKLSIPGSTSSLYCDVSHGLLRPFVPQRYRQQIISKLHCLSHPGGRATKKLISKRYVWPSMCKDIASFVRTCVECQKNKINRHTKSPLGNFGPADRRFDQIHIDIIGPLPPSRGQRYCLTCIDRFSRWPVAIPIPDITTETIAFALINGWIASFGVPSKITSDLGRQFESQIFKELMQLLGVYHLKTTAYHPQANGMVERWHRTLKAAIKCHATNDWTFVLPFVLLGLRTTMKEDINASPAEMLFGSQLRIPGEFFQNKPIQHNNSDFIKDLRHRMQSLKPTSASRHDTDKIFIQPGLKDCCYVFVRVDHVRAPLEAPYEGPFKVINKEETFFKLQIRQRIVNVSIDRLKPAFMPNNTHFVDIQDHRTSAEDPEQILSQPNTTVSDQPKVSVEEVSQDKSSHSSGQPVNNTTRSGRHVRFPARFL